MAEPARKLATFEDLLALPDNVKGEILDGVLYTQPRPRFRHMYATAFMDRRIGNRYGEDPGDPGGWWILPEPGIEVPGSPEFSPDLAGWRRERMPDPPEENQSITVVPDWICEILSPSTRAYDQRTKKPFYAKHQVQYLWIVDPESHLLMASRLENGRWVELGTWGDDDRVRVEPFEAVELNLAELWPKKREKPAE
jgi:Uma2 family endonuclease